MRGALLTIRSSLRQLGLGGLATRLAEVGAWILLYVAFEALGRLLPTYDAASLGVLTLGVGPLALGAVALARRGRLPLATALCRRLGEAARGLGRRFTPRFEFAFRLGTGVEARRDATLLTSILLLAAAVVAVTVAPRLVFDGLSALRQHGSFTLQLGLLGLLWSGVLMLLTLGLVLEVQRVGAPVAMGIWVGGLIPALLLPGAVWVVAILLVALVQDVRLGRRQLAPYLFCRRSASGAVHAVRAQTVLRRLHVLAALGTALVLALANGERLWRPGVVQGDHAFTAGLGVLAAVPALLLALRVAAHFGRLFHLRGEPPETPLKPTLWWRGGLPDPVAAEALVDGWDVVSASRPGAAEYDLVTPAEGRPHGWTYDPHAPPAQRCFSRRRRFHVVHRREFLRRLEVLVKLTRPDARRRGTGFVFCPHAWLVPNLLRDAGRAARPVGPAFESLFPARTRRYLGQLLRAMEVDLVYWEDAIRWSDLKRVFGVAFECFDQARLPLRERHFVGLPRVRVLLQDEDGPGGAPQPRRAGLPSLPVGTGARVLLILRDRGGEPVREEADSPADSRPVPQSV